MKDHHFGRLELLAHRDREHLTHVSTKFCDGRYD